jgi:hypothetical protein
MLKNYIIRSDAFVAAHQAHSPYLAAESEVITGYEDN